MAGKRALVVDDSKSARAFLTRILETYALEVDSAESAEQAIDYLTRHRPDVIFMDHLMPGMDGFQAVQAIKNNARTATIPIMMYTSQEGELYLGQARALGAIGVLPKQIRPADVSKVLYELHLVEDRRTGSRITFPAGVEPPADAAARERPSPSATATTAMHAALSLTAGSEILLRDQIAELRRFVASSMDAQSERVLDEVRQILRDLPAPELPPPVAPPPPPPVEHRGWGLAAAALLGVLVMTALWWHESTQRQQLTARLEQLIQEAGRSSAAEETAPAAAVAASPATATPGTAGGAAIVEPVPFGEAPFSGPRVERVRGILRSLAERGFRGTVEVETFPGRFCLAGNASDGYSLAPADTPVSGCDLVGIPPGDAPTGAQRESLPFANMIAEIRKSSGIAVRVGSGSSDATVAAYPAGSNQITAAQWNAAAAANNRIEIRWHPQS